MLDLRQIQYFVCLYEEGSFTRAAQRLNVVQPALSMQMGRLEKRLRVDLFERTPRGVTPTPAGEQLYRLYQPILLDLRNADQLAIELSGKVVGKIAVGIIPSITNSVLADVLSRFGSKYPEVEIRIDEAYSGTLIDWVVSGDLDIAVVNSARRKEGISSHPLVAEELLLVERRNSGKAPLSRSRSETCAGSISCCPRAATVSAPSSMRSPSSRDSRSCRRSRSTRCHRP